MGASRYPGPAGAGGSGTAAPHLPQAGDGSLSAVSSRNCAMGYGSLMSSDASALPAVRTGLASLKDALLHLSCLRR